MRSLARVLSVVLHPVWMPTIILVLAFTTDPFLSFRFLPKQRLYFYGMVLCMTGIFPALSTFMLWRSGLVSSTSLPTRGERVMPFLLTLFYYGTTYYLLRHTPSHPVTLSLFFAAALALFLTLLITLRWKISAHMVGIGGLLGALLGMMAVHGTHAPLLLASAFVAAGVLGTARLLDSDHSPAQVYAGALLGATCTLGCIVYGIAP
ncbi:MAG: hypothetical protein QM724_02915 [Flavobacteriales bacterium]